MRGKVVEREEARALRTAGWSLGRIAAALGVAKSSVSIWGRDVPVPLRDVPPAKVIGRPVSGPVVEGPGKPCGRCHRMLTLDSFNRAGEGRQHWCRECFRTYFKDRGQRHRDQTRKAHKARMQASRNLVLETLKRSGCLDCGEDEVVVLEFDHVGAKRGNIAQMMRAGLPAERLREELDQCEVVCACCHRRRTARRAGWFRATGIPNVNWTARHRRNQEHILSVLEFGGCVDCGEPDPVVLEFGHIGEKQTHVAALAAFASLKQLKIEIAQCELRCCNCHRLVTYARRGGTWKDSLEWLSLDDVL